MVHEHLASQLLFQGCFCPSETSGMSDHRTQNLSVYMLSAFCPEVSQVQAAIFFSISVLSSYATLTLGLLHGQIDWYNPASARRRIGPRTGQQAPGRE